MRTSPLSFIIVPGIGNSGEDHWQTLWQRAQPEIRRIAPLDWDNPAVADWVAALDAAITASVSPPVLIAHSLGCLLAAHWRHRSAARVAGAFMVAVPDPGAGPFPAAAHRFAELPSVDFDFPLLMLASGDDPYAELSYARARAQAWGAQLIDVGARGHLNAESGLGFWQDGWNLLQAFSAGCLAGTD